MVPGHTAPEPCLLRLHELRAQDESRRPPRLLRIDEHRDEDALGPGAADDLLDRGFAAVESVLALFRVEQKAVEVADPVVDQTVHFAGESRSFIVLAVVMVVMVLVAVLAVAVLAAIVIVLAVIVAVVVMIVVMTLVAVVMLFVHGDYVLPEACRCSLIPRREGREAR
ncbi:MAG: hypothetical protein JWM87_209 [Candidatus Eremiobacteraeota bacterium]|nr:hypothetical protein [Candidatus Eremiobacteraeota bacterium]